ncbi:hypothetical protein NDU88_001394 [Pleurodeles waltl]|uniref:Uncharacterized protein n=1 Tax=Pleurodeles waltl TaxID=8319 RepID=A0AAV7P5N8_PLEWA|nr:hypothetical protein NDU88_001394 [Pleurodeles waltl]
MAPSAVFAWVAPEATQRAALPIGHAWDTRDERAVKGEVPERQGEAVRNRPRKEEVGECGVLRLAPVDYRQKTNRTMPSETQRLQRTLSHVALCSQARSLPFRKRSVSRGLKGLKNEPQAQNPYRDIPIANERQRDSNCREKVLQIAREGRKSTLWWTRVTAMQICAQAKKKPSACGDCKARNAKAAEAFHQYNKQCKGSKFGKRLN